MNSVCKMDYTDWHVFHPTLFISNILGSSVATQKTVVVSQPPSC